jgi:hypothetical protein
MPGSTVASRPDQLSACGVVKKSIPLTSHPAYLAIWKLNKEGTPPPERPLASQDRTYPEPVC